jgi:hypothetical protein
MAIVAQHFDSCLGRWTHAGWMPGPGHPLEWAVDRGNDSRAVKRQPL